MRAHVKAQQEAFEDRPTAVRLSAEFHILLAELAGSQTLLRLVTDVVTRSSLVFLAQATTHALCCGPKEHSGIIEAIVAGNADEAEQHLRQHLHDVDDRSRYIPSPAKDFADLPGRRPRTRTRRKTK